MAWTAPILQLGPSFPADSFNDAVDAIVGLNETPQSEIQSNTSQSVPNNTRTKMNLQTSLFTQGLMFADSGLTIETSGRYLISASINWATGATGWRRLELGINTSPILAVSQPGAATVSPTVSLALPVTLTAGMVITIFGTQTSGGALAVAAGNAHLGLILLAYS